MAVASTGYRFWVGPYRDLYSAIRGVERQVVRHIADPP